MNRLAPVFIAVGGAGLALSTQLALANSAFSGRASLVPYLFGYFLSILAFVIAGWLSLKQEPRKPLIVPLRYGKFDDGVRKINGRWHKADGTAFTVDEVLIGRHVGKFGLFVKNDGEAAYDLSASGPHIGTSILKFETDKNRLAKEDGEEFLPTFIETSPQNVSFGSGLFDEMRTKKVDAIEIELTYKDAGNHWYKTVFEIERDVLAPGGLTVRYVSQKNLRSNKNGRTHA